jgi:oligosaccharide repeat unit polymerase
MIGYYLFGKWFNPISLYCSVWYVNLGLFELKLMNYTPLTSFAWFVISVAYLSYLFGIFTYISASKIAPRNFNGISSKNYLSVFLNSNNEAAVKWIIFITGAIGLFDSLWHWMILINKYGSFAGVFLNANEIYSLRVKGKLEGLLPYLLAFPFVGVFYSGFLLGKWHKFSFIIILPITAIIMKEIANFGRANMLFAIFLFMASLVVSSSLSMKEKRMKIKFNLKLVSVILFIMIFFFSAASFVRGSRGSFESFTASTRNLSKFEDSFFITPSLYLYLSSHVGILSKYLEHDFDTNNFMFGQTTFQPIYNLMSRFNLVEHPPFYDKGYYTPMWSNTGTFLRNIHEDFGELGLIVFPFLLGLFITYFWFKLSESPSLPRIITVSYILVIILFSFMMMYSRAATFMISLILSYMAAYFVKDKDIKSTSFTGSNSGYIK